MLGPACYHTNSDIPLGHTSNRAYIFAETAKKYALVNVY